MIKLKDVVITESWAVQPPDNELQAAVDVFLASYVPSGGDPAAVLAQHLGGILEGPIMPERDVDTVEAADEEEEEESQESLAGRPAAPLGLTRTQEGMVKHLLDRWANYP